MPLRRRVLPAIILAATCLGARLAQAAPPPGTDPQSSIAQWYRSLMRPDTGGSCCDAADCRQTLARQTEIGWEAQIDGHWISVPESKVLEDRHHPAGAAVLCYLPGIGVMCFVKPGAGI